MQKSRREVLTYLSSIAPLAMSKRLFNFSPFLAESGGGKIASSAERGLASGPFQPTWESLKQYQTPDWFRDAKFGIWAHWTAQCVPEQGDWYARRMYIQGDPANVFHLAHYGHPSKFGFKDIDFLWKAENWDPEHLMDLYVKAGAKYFMSLANHHDNFDNYDSKYHNWNSTRIGPRKDIVGTWAKAARKRGLRFGVSNHSAHAWHWQQTAYGYDQTGPMAGVRYDGFATKAQGKGKAWEGFDPQELYVGPSFVMPDGITTKKEADAWHEEHDRRWSEQPPPEHPEFTNSWFLRCKDLLDTYSPDMLYFDDTELPLGQTGLDIVSHYYNSSLKKHGGKLEAVVFGKGFSPEHLGAAVLDIERGRSNEILAKPWQTDTCIGDWHYRRSLYEQHGYKSARTVIHMLLDIVSKNGNLCLSIPLRGDGTIDPDERKVLDELAAWMPANGEAIYGTRPFKIFGEGPPDVVSTGNFNEGKGRPYTAEDFRFTTKGGRLYATALGWPDSGKLRIKTLARGSQVVPGEISKVELLGAEGSLHFERDPDGLVATLPSQKPNDIAYALRITTTNLGM